MSTVYNCIVLGCDAVGSAAYCDPNPEENIRIIFALAKEFNCPVDFHLGR
jgi:cytosine/creatinine deaminase